MCAVTFLPWWRHQMETFSMSLAFCAGNSPVTGEFPAQKASNMELWSFSICAWINGWVNSPEAGDLRRHRAHYDVTVMLNWFYYIGSSTKGVLWTSWSPMHRNEPSITYSSWGIISEISHFVCYRLAENARTKTPGEAPFGRACGDRQQARRTRSAPG